MNIEDWNRALIWEAKYLIEKKAYGIGSAMQKIWDRNYPTLESNNEIDIQELRELFWSKGHEELDRFNDEILRRYENE